MSTLILTFNEEQTITDLNQIQFSTCIGNTLVGWPSSIAKVTVEVNGGPAANGYYHNAVVFCDQSVVNPSNKTIIKTGQRGLMEIGGKSHAERIIAGLQKAIELGWLK